MKKKIIIVLFSIITILGISGCKVKENTDALKFKEEYESLNDTKSNSGKTIRTLSIGKNNPIKYSSDEEIVKMIKNKKTFVVYFGFASCPWCRSILPNLLKAASDLNLNTIYYVDVTNIRDVMKLDEEEKIITEKKGTDGYNELLKLLDDVLENYTLKNTKDEEIPTGKKRIYAPNIVSIVNGKAEGFTTGISEEQTDGYMQLTDKMNQDSYNSIKCNIRCVTNKNSKCSLKSMC